MLFLQRLKKTPANLVHVLRRLFEGLRHFSFKKTVGKVKDIKNTSTALVVRKDPEEWKKLRHNMQQFVVTSGSNAVIALDKSIHYIASTKTSKTDNEVMNVVRGPLVFGIWVILILVGVFGVWAMLAPLDSAAVAKGTVVVDSSRKTIQHLEGGIIEEILVKEGEAVKVGQSLIQLNDTNARARLGLVSGQLFSIKVAELRLIAERDGADNIDFPEDLLEQSKKQELQKILESHQRLFKARRSSINGQINVLNQQMVQLNEEIMGVQAQVKSSEDQLALINEEISVVKKLLERGNANKPRLLALQRQAALLSGNRGEYLARVAQARQLITKAELEITNIEANFLSDIVTELKEIQVQIADLGERKRAAQDVLDRTVIVAPDNGIITDMQFHTHGGVIAGGARILDIVPQGEKLTVDTRISLQDIDVVHPGLIARIRLTAFKRRSTPILEGTVDRVSADKLFDKVTGESYYRAKIIVNEEMLSHLNNKNIKLYPGMAVEVMIVTGERSFMDYMLSPITDTFARAFREQ